MPDRITRLVPVARSVTLGDRDFTVWEARLLDLAALQSWLEAGWLEPLDAALDAALADPDGPGRSAAIHAALDAAEPGPPSYDDDRGAAALATAEGIGSFLAVALARGNPGLTVDDVIGCVRSMTPAQYARLRRVFFGTDREAALNRLLIGDIEQAGGGGEALTWGEAVDELAAARGWTYPEIYAMTISEFRNARRGGKPAEAARGIRVSLGAGLKRARAAVAARLGQVFGADK